MNIKEYGFNGYFEALSAEYPNLTPARVTVEERELYRIVSNDGEQLASVSGKFRYQAETASDYPAVGDFVMVDHTGEEGNAVIHAVLPRKSVFTRRAAGTANREQVVAANIDTVFICMSLNNDFNIRRLERYLSVAWDSGATPVILLTKADLCEDISGRISEVESVAFGVDTVVTSSLRQDGIADIMPYLKQGKTASFIGSSGVGKSTLINRLLGSDVIATNGLRNDDKGRHTTTHRELILLSNGAMVVDTPGMRELGMWGAESGIDTAFADIEELSVSCKYKNCTHTGEAGCAVREAIAKGELSEERYKSYTKLMAENAYAEDSDSYLVSKEKKFKEIAKYNKTNRKR
jgi:ribosome biogenesis GTPase